MSTSRQRQRGLTIVELVMFIVIISVALVGVLQVLNLASTRSVEPLRRKQALAIAEAMLEEVELARFTFCDPTDPNAATAVSPAACLVAENFGREAGEVRPFDNVNDYVAANGVPLAYATDAAGAAFQAGYATTVTITPDAGLGPGGATVPSDSALRIRVQVSYENNNNIVLEGYRTRYAPTAVP